MSFFTVNVALPRTVELTICARDKRLARRAAAEFVKTAFANALQFWDDNEPICDDEGRLLGMVQIEMPDEGEIELVPDAIEITAREESRQWPEPGQVRLTARGIEL
jgi:hypothetical protein